jgi:hypothetical protein
MQIKDQILGLDTAFSPTIWLAESAMAAAPWPEVVPSIQKGFQVACGVNLR